MILVLRCPLESVTGVTTVTLAANSSLKGVSLCAFFFYVTIIVTRSFILFVLAVCDSCDVCDGVYLPRDTLMRELSFVIRLRSWRTRS